MISLTRLAVAMVLAAMAGAAMAQSFTVPRELWDRPRTGQAVLEQPAIHGAVNAYLEHEGSHLVVHHGPRQESLLLAEELRAWLVALAVEPSRVTLQNDLKIDEPLQVEVRQDGT